MALLYNGGTAVEAVEMAIKALEDKEITNAGYGSNLTLEGTVECDATVVDHFGRSGAVGAVGRENLLAVKALTTAKYSRCIQSDLPRLPSPHILHQTLVPSSSSSESFSRKGAPQTLLPKLGCPSYLAMLSFQPEHIRDFIGGPTT